MLTLSETVDDRLLIPETPLVALRRFDMVNTKLAVAVVPVAVVLLSLVPLALEELLED